MRAQGWSRWLALGCGLGLLALSLRSEWPLASATLAFGLLGALGLLWRTPPAPELPADPERGAPEARLHAVLDALSAATILIDPRGLVVHANAAALEAFPVLTPGTPVVFVLRSPPVVGAIEAVLKGQAEAKAELLERVPLERSFDVFARRLEAGAGERRSGVADAVIFMPETTAARRLDALRADFVANASHELRTPLASVLGFVETLQGSARNDEAVRERFLGIMAEQARRMARLIEDLLSLSRIEMNEHIPPSKPVEVAGALRSALDALSTLARERSVVLETAIEPGEHPVAGERDELMRVFDNLIENAIKYGQSGGRVLVGLERTTDAVLGAALRISVRDFGPGIAPEHLPRLTERFYRADVTASRGQGGTGLGLAIVKHIVTRHRGRLVIESRLGEGASFTLLLPLQPSREKHQAIQGDKLS